tara:strand:+ start:1246 stop:3096 length:1851 start_codon:yes stop_codon:yes gene_type:complete
MADIIVDAEIKADVGQLEQSLQQAETSVNGLAQGFGIATGAIATVQGAMKLLGTESDKVNKAILQVQAAMSLNQGVQSLLAQRKAIVGIASVIGKWTGATKVLAAGQKALNLIMAANPIGLIIAGVTALVGLGSAIVKFFKDSAAATKEETEALKENNKAVLANLGAKSKEIDKDTEREAHELRMQKIKGMTIKQYYDEAIAIQETARVKQKALQTEAKDEIKKAKETLEQLRKNNDEESAIIENQKAQIRGLVEERDKATANLKDINKEVIKLKRDFQADVAMRDADNERKRQEKEKENERKAVARQEKARRDRYNANVNFLAQIRKLEDEATLASIDDDRERENKKAEIQFEAQKKELEKSKAGPKVKAEMLKQLEDQLQRELQAIKKKYDDEAEEDEKTRLATLRAMIDENENALEKDETKRAIDALTRERTRQLKDLEEHKDYIKLKEQIDIKYNREVKQLTDERIKNDKLANQELVAASLSASSKLLKGASEFAEDNKAMAAGAAIIDTYAAAAGALREGKGTPLSYIMAASVIAAGFKSVQAIYDTDTGAGGGTGGSAPSMETTPAPQMMSGNFELGQGVTPEPTKAFVITDEMTNSQNQLANIRRRSTI